MMQHGGTRHTGHGTRGREALAGLWLLSVFAIGGLTVGGVCSLLFAVTPAEAAVSKGKDQQLEVGGTTQGGGVVTSPNFRQQVSLGEAVAGGRISSARFRLSPGFIGAGLSAQQPLAPVSELQVRTLYAKTDPLGTTIPPQTWQKDADPVFIWEAPQTGAELAGYSYAVDATPDDTVDSTGTSFNVQTSLLRSLTDGKHVFSVKAVNTAGHSGPPTLFELWVDITPPQITGYTPGVGVLLNTPRSTVTATVSDVSSGIAQSGIALLVNGAPASVAFAGQTGTITASDVAWHEGRNSVELRVADIAGNAQTPLVWSMTVDTIPPTGTVMINGGAELTTSVYVTLGLSASDETSGIARMLLSNEELAGYVEEPYVALRELWKLTPIRGPQQVYVKFVDRAGNVSAPISDGIEVGLLAPDTVITRGPAGTLPNHTGEFTFMCPEGDCLFSYAFDNEKWSPWAATPSVSESDLIFGNHYFRVKAAKDVNGIAGIQPDEEDPSPAERTWVVGVETPLITIPKGPPIKVWRLE